MEKLDYLSSDPYTIELYKAREDSEHEKANFYSSGQDNKAKEIAQNLIAMGMTDDVIIKATGLSIEEINSLR